jgi:hypothetical protein
MYADKMFRDDALGVDASPLFSSAYIADRIAAVYGANKRKLKFVVVLRDPVARVRSWFSHFHR